jgi:aminoglycoside 6'-N-acetyltransferase I
MKENGVRVDVNLDIVEMDPDRLTPFAELYVDVFNSPPWSEEWTVPIALARLGEIAGTPGFLGLAVLDEESVVGFVAGYGETFLDGTDFYIKEMCVKTDRQRQGIGTALLDCLRARLTDDGVRKMYLLTARESSAEAFYAKSGFYTSEKMIMMGQWLRPREEG